MNELQERNICFDRTNGKWSRELAELPPERGVPTKTVRDELYGMHCEIKMPPIGRSRSFKYACLQNRRCLFVWSICLSGRHIPRISSKSRCGRVEEEEGHPTRIGGVWLGRGRAGGGGGGGGEEDEDELSRHSMRDLCKSYRSSRSSSSSSWQKQLTTKFRTKFRELGDSDCAKTGRILFIQYPCLPETRR